MRRALLVAAVATALALPVAAADRAGRYSVKGVGLARCADFNAALARRTPELGQMLSWVAGYVTAANRYEPATYDLVAWQDELYILGSIRTYCGANPRTTLAEMARALVRSLGPGRLAAASPPQTILVGNRRLTLASAVIVRAKTALARRGHYRGTLDASPGAGFLRAVAAFQQSERLAPTGLPDQETLFRLFAPAP